MLAASERETDESILRVEPSFIVMVLPLATDTDVETPVVCLKYNCEPLLKVIFSEATRFPLTFIKPLIVAAEPISSVPAA